MKSRFCGVVCWCAADAVAIAVAVGWPGWILPVLTWLALIAMLACAGLIPVHQRM